MDSAFFERPVSRIGDLFKDRRLFLGRQTEEFSRELNIPLRYLEALEGSDYCAVPMPFTKPWLRSYSESLGLAWENLGGRAIAEWQARQRRCELPRKTSGRPASRSLVQRSRLWVLAVMVGLAGIAYISAAVVPTFLPPPLSIDGLASESRTNNKSAAVVIRSLPMMHLTVNGAEYTTDDRGQARVVIDLMNGVNTVVVSAKRAHSQPRVVTYTIAKE